jgi:hypothetical protein
MYLPLLFIYDTFPDIIALRSVQQKYRYALTRCLRLTLKKRDMCNGTYLSVYLLNLMIVILRVLHNQV